VGTITPRPGAGPTGKQNLQQVEQLPADALIAGDSDANRSWVKPPSIRESCSVRLL
jgi:hypothetical protein